jgi:large subunit ribosomal protein L22
MEAVARLNKCPLSPRKMRLVVEQIRGQKVDKALNALQFSQRRYYAIYVEKLLKSAIANWEQKYEGRAEDNELYVKTVFVDCGAMMKRLRTAPQGRAHRQRKRSNHITIVVDSLLIIDDETDVTDNEVTEETNNQNAE